MFISKLSHHVYGASFVSKASVVLSVLLSLGCGDSLQRKQASASDLEGLSASSSAKNAAVLVQGNLQEAANDIRLLEPVLNDETGDYQFAINKQLGATTGTALSAISTAAGKVGPNGTLFIYLGGHGSPDGGSQMNDGRLLYYQQIRKILSTELRQPIQRLVLVVFGCYSGSWINNINRAGDIPTSPEALSEHNIALALDTFATPEGESLYKQLIVMTSSSAGQLSYYTPGRTSHLVDAFSKTFNQLKSRSSEATIQDLVNGVKGTVRTSAVTSAVNPSSVLSEPLFNSAM